MRVNLQFVGTAFLALLAVQAAPAAGQGGAGAQTASTPPADRLICRSTPETGSLARRRRQCFTRAQWDRMAEVARLRGGDLQGGAFSVESSN